MAAREYETNFIFSCWKYLSLEDKIRIPARPRNILYISDNYAPLASCSRLWENLSKILIFKILD